MRSERHRWKMGCRGLGSAIEGPRSFHWAEEWTVGQHTGAERREWMGMGEWDYH